MNAQLTSESLSAFIGGTVDFSNLGMLLAAGIEKIEILENPQRLKMSLGWTGVIERGIWQEFSPSVQYLQTELAFLRDVDRPRHNKLKVEFHHHGYTWC